MKAVLTRKARKVASALLVSLVLTTILSVSIMGYLTVVEQSNMLGARSQTWNMAIAVVEAGIEEGLQQLQSNNGSLSADGWSPNGNVYTLNRTMPDGNSYTVKIDNSSPNSPVVTCLAAVTPPSFVQNRLLSYFATAGLPAPTPSGVRRAVMVRTSKGNLFTAALVAKHDINLNGNGVYTDSYDSTDSTKSTAGKYDLSKYSGDKGDIATNGGVTNSASVSVGNANIYGKVHVGGPDASVSFLPQGGVGPHGSQVSDVTTAKSLGYILEDANFTYPDTSLPNYASYLQPQSGTVVTWTNNIASTSTNSSVYPGSPWGGATTNMASTSTLPSPMPPGTTTNTATSTTTTSTYPAPGSYVGTVTTNINGFTHVKSYTYYLIVGITYNYPTYSYNLYQTNTTFFTNTYDYVLNADTKYVANSLSGTTCVLGPNVTLVMPNGLSGAENFTFNQGAAVLVYSGGSSVTINGNQYLNPNFVPSSFIVYCTPSVTSFTLNGNGQFTGVLVAPNANIKLNGGGSSYEDFCGSLMVNTATFNGHFRFHYDESLSHMPSNGRFLISGWDEIDPATF